MRFIARWLRRAAASLLILILIGWLIGRVATDRYGWSQWLFWIPTPGAIIVTLVLWSILGFRSARAGCEHPRRRLNLVGAAATIALLLYFSAVEHRLFRATPPRPEPGEALKVVHWNAEPLLHTDIPLSVDVIQKLAGDITVITNPGGRHLQDVADQDRSEEMQMITVHPFALFTRLPIVNVRSLVMVDLMYVVLVELDATTQFGRHFYIYLVDMPSDPRLGRAAMASGVRAMLDDRGVPAPDLVVGDFNMTRGGAALSIMFPGTRHAFQDSGHGYGGTYPRAWPVPLLHIDHILLGGEWIALRYDIIDPGMSRHHAQIAWVRPRHAARLRP